MQSLDSRTARLMNFAGFALAHAVGRVATGDTLCTMALLERSGERALAEFPGKIEDAVGQARTSLEGMADLGRSALVYDALVSVAGEQTEAVVVEACNAGALGYPTVMIQRYASAKDGQPFAVLGETLFPEVDDDERAGSLREAVLEGGRGHDDAWAVWMKSLKE